MASAPLTLAMSAFLAVSVSPLVAAQDLSPERQVELERLVVQDCGSCHGLTMKGGLGRAITPDLMQYWDREALRDVILDGVPGTAMPPWRYLLTETEATWIADYLQGQSGDGS